MSSKGFITVLIVALALMLQLSIGYWRTREYSRATGTSFIKSMFIIK